MTARVFGILDAMAARLSGLHGRNRALAAFLAGALCCLGLPPLSWFPVLWLGFPVLFWLLQGAQSPRQAFIVGWCFAFGYFLFSLYWIAASMFVDLPRFGWMIPFTVAGLPALFGSYYGLAAILWRRLPWRGASAALGLGWLFALAEYARGFLFTGFPWNLFGYVWIEWLPMAQGTSLIGSYGLTLLTLTAAALPGALAGQDSRRAALIANGGALLVLALLGLWGAQRLADHPTIYAPGALVRLVQPNIAQSLKWDGREREGNFDRLLALTAQPGPLTPTHIIWPETAVTWLLADDLPRRLRIAAILPEHGVLLTGAPRESGDDLFNAVLALDRSGAIIAAYDKAHLVPFGEYVPFRSFGPIAAAAAGLGAFTPGPGARSLHVPGLPPFSPLICYEVIFPHRVADAHDPPSLLVNVTNDAWYGRTAGPHQHLAIARMRAIEEGLPLLRAANTGISAVIDANGRILQSLPLGARGIIDTQIPTAAPTVAARYGAAPFLLIWFLIGSGLLFFGIWRKKYALKN